MRILFVTLFVFLSVSAFSQKKSKYIYIHVSDKSVTLTPFYKVFGSNFDPAVTFGGEFDHIENEKSTIFQNVEGTAYSHALTGGGLSLSTSLGYRYQIYGGLFAEGMLGLMGSGFVSGRESFSLNDSSGEYERVTPMHWTFGVPIDMGVGYEVGKYSFYLRYRYELQGRYADILPIIPSSYMSLGFRYLVLGAR